MTLRTLPAMARHRSPSHADTGLAYLGASARLSYVLGEEETLPDSLTRTNKRGVPV
jgi:amino acid permease